MERWQDTTYTWRVNRRLNQWRAAGIVGVSLTTWSRWERGQTEPSAEAARAALEAMRNWDESRIAVGETRF